MKPADSTQIKQKFQALYESGSLVGGQLVVLQDGAPVIDEVVGWANLKKRQPVTQETPFLPSQLQKCLPVSVSTSC